MRLSDRLPAPTAITGAAAEPSRSAASVGPVVATSPAAGEDDVAISNWPDEEAESEFRADARDRGESVRATRESSDAAEEPDGESLPTLDELVARLSPGVRETLEDLFRARFVAVKRVPKSALKP